MLGMATLAAIAAHFGASEDTAEPTGKFEQGMSFADHFGQKRKSGFVSLRWEFLFATSTPSPLRIGWNLPEPLYSPAAHSVRKSPLGD